VRDAWMVALSVDERARRGLQRQTGERDSLTPSTDPVIT